MHSMDGSISSAVAPTAGRSGDGVLSIRSTDGGQETPSESSEADSSECDTGDEDGWESGESSASLVLNHHHEHQQHHLLTHSSSRTHVSNVRPRANLKETAKGLLRGDKNRSSNRQSATGAIAKRSSATLARSATLDT